MKKIDFHIHTIKTFSDPNFEFDVNVLKNYIDTMNIDAIAITNHNLFDIKQYKDILNKIPNTIIFPGIEINIGNNCGHMLVITKPEEIEDFNSRCLKVTSLIHSSEDAINISQLKEIFGELERYLLIPHYDKKPHVDKHILEDLKPYILCGEVNSIKKFIYNIKNPSSLVPVYFSDMRAETNLTEFPIRQTFFDIDNINLNTIKFCLKDKSKVSLTKQEGHDKFIALPDLELSTGLNIIIGERSSGKTHTLDNIYNKFNINNNVKYIKQFSLVELDEKKAKETFKNSFNIQQSSIAKNYFADFSKVVDDVKDISLENDTKELEKYLTSLLKHASEIEREDMFSKCLLYSESEFQINDLKNIKELIKAIEVLLDNIQYRSIIDKYIDKHILINLRLDLINQAVCERQIALKKLWTNDLVTAIKRNLQSNTAATRIYDIDFYKMQSNRMKINKFNQVVTLIKKSKKIYSKDLEGFKIQATTIPFNMSSELKNHSGKKISFSNAFSVYNNNAYTYLQRLKDINDLDETTYYEYFMNVEFKILNQYGYEISGGERAEFNLLQEINDAYKYDLLLIDEPESSFDNLFLKNRVNSLLKTISKEIPVIIVTHNNTIGASIKPDYLIYTQRIVSNSGIRYKIYSGYPSSKYLIDENGNKFKDIDAILNCLEAGQNAYSERRDSYEMLRNQ